MNGYTMFVKENMSQAKSHESDCRFILVLTAESSGDNESVVTIIIDKDRFSDAINSLYTMRNHAYVCCTKRYMLCLYQRHSDGIMHKVGYCFR